ncbi:hypothetical protein [Aquaticitalea lipolytica]|nr:hypothetical protein [Aquaticitalea lipolytica]
MNSFIALFYSASPATNGHPEPNIANFILSITLGGIIGNKTYKLMIKNRDKSNL